MSQGEGMGAGCADTPPAAFGVTPLIEGGCVALFQYSPRLAFGMSPQQSSGLLRSPLDCFALNEGGMNKNVSRETLKLVFGFCS